MNAHDYIRLTILGFSELLLLASLLRNVDWQNVSAWQAAMLALLLFAGCGLIAMTCFDAVLRQSEERARFEADMKKIDQMTEDYHKRWDSQPEEKP